MLQATRFLLQSDTKAQDCWTKTTTTDQRQALDTVVSEALTPVSLGLAVLFSIFALSHALLLTPSAAWVMLPTASGSAVLLFSLFSWSRRRTIPSHWAHPLGSGVAGIILINSLLHLYLLAEPRQTTNLLLLILGVGCLFLSTRWLSLVLTATLVGWSSIVWVQAERDGWSHFGFMLLGGTILSLLIHMTRKQTLGRLHQLRLHDERRQMELEQALIAESETAAELRAILSAFPDLYFRLDADGTILDYHAGRVADLYVTPEIFLGKRMTEVLPAEVGHLTQTALQQVQATKEMAKVEYSLLMPQGEQYFETRLVALSSTQVFAIVRDVTERHRAEEALQHAHDSLETQVRERTAELTQTNIFLQEQMQERQRIAAEREHLFEEVRAAKQLWEQTFDAISEGILVCDKQGQIVRCNARAMAMLGVADPYEVVGLSCCEVFQKLFGPQATKQLQAQENHVFSVEITAEDGRRFLVSGALLQGVGLQPEQPDWKVMTWSDVTDLQIMHEQLERARRLATIGQLAAGVAHEINNPLTAVTTCAEAILRDLRGFPAVTALATEREWPFYLEEIIRQSLRCKAITRGLVDLSMQRRLQRTACDLNAVVTECARLAAQRGETARVNIVLQLDPHLREIATDGVMLRQILDNLLANALEAVGAEGVIIVATACEGNRVSIAVSDTGCGIPPEVRPRIFEPFFTTKEAGQGAGLGLAICAMLAETLDGEIEVESEPNTGSRFCVSLPQTLATVSAFQQSV
ncbi:MAG TPA: ATP-binding protein [Blastocatellia bacterium]|nr:ATP-binding protein [Blastocatellia bacterium]